MRPFLPPKAPSSSSPGSRLFGRAAAHPVVRGGLTIGAGIVIGNALGFGRVAVTAYLLGTQSRADALAVSLGPIDTLNGLLINSFVFSFVPMLAAREGVERTALFLKMRSVFGGLFAAASLLIALFAPWLLRVLAPGLAAEYFNTGVGILRIVAFSSIGSGLVAIHAALLYTDRRFAPTAFYQATMNTVTIAGALLLWNTLGVYGFAIGYTAGAWIQLAIAWTAARRHLTRGAVLPSPPLRSLLLRPGPVLFYAMALSVSITFTRAYATHAGAGMAAALDYCMRGINVPMAFLVSPLSNSLLPEIARLRTGFQLRRAYWLIDRSLALVALAAVAICAVAIALREPVIRLMFQRGSFTAESTAIVSAVFLGLAPSLVGWSLIELSSRTLFALEQPLIPSIIALLPVVVNAAVTLAIHSTRPEFIGVGASAGFLAAFAVLLLASSARRNRTIAPSQRSAVT